MSNRNVDAAERKERIAAIQAAQRKSERRRTIIIASIVGVVILALIGTTLFFVLGELGEQRERDQAAESPIEGVEEFDDLTNNHVEGAVEYPQTPPVGGDHNAVWQNCGVYTQPVDNVNAVHSLEHGAVWITYDPDLPADQVELLQAQAAANNYVLVTPYEGLPSPVVATAWGLQLQLQDAADERLGVFVTKYVRGEQTLEPGAACSGGTGTPQ